MRRILVGGYLLAIVNVFLIGCMDVCAQDNDRYRSVRFTFDNDFINFSGHGTDRYYTNGLQLEYSNLLKGKKQPADKILLTIGDGSCITAHWGLSQQIFTPDDISRQQVMYNNRPYAGTLYLTRGMTSFNPAKKLALHSEINLGVIGPYSFAKEVQTWAHRAIAYIKPEGWGNQIKTDVIVNYNVEADKQVYQSRSLQGDIQLSGRFGTLYNDLGMGVSIKAGKILPFLHGFENICMQVLRKGKNGSEVYFFGNGQLRYVIGNSLLQGGVIQTLRNGSKPFYHITEGEVHRWVATYEFGLVINRPAWGISVSQNFISTEFKTADTQMFGRISVIRRFK